MSAGTCEQLHGPECPFSGSEADRCPWCHETWQAIRCKAMHACERLSTWDDDARTMVREAGRVRRAAARDLQQ